MADYPAATLGPTDPSITEIHVTVPPLTWEDVLWLQVMTWAYSPDAIASLPRGRPLTQMEISVLYATAIAITLAHGPELGWAAGVLPHGYRPGKELLKQPEELNRLLSRLHRWRATDVKRALAQDAHDDPRMTRLSNVYTALARTAFARHVALDGGLVKDVRSAAERRSIHLDLSDFGPVVEAVGEIDVRAFFVGKDGQTHLNTRAVVDKLRRRPKHHDLPTNPDNVISPELAADEADPAAAAETAEIVRIVRDQCRARGPAAQAAFDYVARLGTRAELAGRYGVTVDAIRHAEPWVRDRFRRLAG